MATIVPSIDHYHGRKVEGISIPDTDKWKWAITLTGGVLIRNHDPEVVEPPAEIVGMTFARSMLSELDTRLQFTTGGNEHLEEPAPAFVEVTLNPTQYSIAGPGIEKEFFPQRPEELEMMLPEAYQTDYLTERELEGPPEDWQAQAEGAVSPSEAPEDEGEGQTPPEAS